MAQRLRSCSKTTNFETINCEGYLSSLRKDKRNKQASGLKCVCPRADSLNRTKASSNALLALPTTPPNLKSRPGSNKQQNLAPSKRRSSHQNAVHREIMDDSSALVEVTVRTRTNKNSCKTIETKDRHRQSLTNREGRDKHTESWVGRDEKNKCSPYWADVEAKDKDRQPWADLLKSSRCFKDVTSSFDNYDPLTTLHFLGRELNSALKSHSGSASVPKILTEMLEALKRIPPEITSFVSNQARDTNLESNDKAATKKKKLNKGDLPEKLTNIIQQPRMEHKVCQTSIDNVMFTKSESLQKSLEGSIKDLDAKCQEMEELCRYLKTEKDQLERQLNSEREAAKYLRNKMEDLQMERITAESTTLNNLTKENLALKAQVKALQMKVDVHQAPTTVDLKRLISELQKQKEEIEKENLSLHHKLTITNIEKEKYLTILALRDRQVKEILSEMNQLQGVVHEELSQFQKSPILSQLSSQSTILGNWQQIQNESKLLNATKRLPTHTNASFISTDTLINQLLSNGDSFRELPSLDSSSSNVGSGDSQGQKLPDSEIPLTVTSRVVGQ